MSFDYWAKQGDHMSKIAKAFGFSDYRRIWDDPGNSSLRNLRDNPHVLMPGDDVLIPARELRIESRAVDQRYPFRAKSRPLRIQIVVKNYDFILQANTPGQLRIELDLADITTDGAGLIKKDIARDDEDGTLFFNRSERPLKIGHLDPVTEVTGQRARLNNLGYRAGPVDEPHPEQFRSAVEEFQCDHKLAVDGNCGPVTQGKLKTIHGC